MEKSWSRDVSGSMSDPFARQIRVLGGDMETTERYAQGWLMRMATCQGLELLASRAFSTLVEALQRFVDDVIGPRHVRRRVQRAVASRASMCSFDRLCYDRRHG